jgi:hypothetical protein
MCRWIIIIIYEKMKIALKLRFSLGIFVERLCLLKIILQNEKVSSFLRKVYETLILSMPIF